MKDDESISERTVAYEKREDQERRDIGTRIAKKLAFARRAFDLSYGSLGDLITKRSSRETSAVNIGTNREIKANK